MARLGSARVRTREGTVDRITLDRHHLLRVLESMQREGAKCPRLEWSFIPLAMSLGVMGVLLTADFRDAFGTPKETWHALAIGTVIVTLGGTLALFAWWMGDRLSHLWRPRKSAEEVVDQIIERMEREEAEYEARRAARRLIS